MAVDGDCRVREDFDYERRSATTCSSQQGTTALRKSGKKMTMRVYLDQVYVRDKNGAGTFLGASPIPTNQDFKTADFRCRFHYVPAQVYFAVVFSFFKESSVKRVCPRTLARFSAIANFRYTSQIFARLCPLRRGRKNNHRNGWNRPSSVDIVKNNSPK